MFTLLCKTMLLLCALSTTSVLNIVNHVALFLISQNSQCLEALPTVLSQSGNLLITSDTATPGM